MSNPVITLANILQNEEIAPGIYLMEIRAPEIARKAKPGQFLHIRCSDTMSPLLRRPISIADANEKAGSIEIIYRIVGEGTQLLSRRGIGENADIIGPLGNGFPLPEKGEMPVITAGGIGTAPILYLAKKLAQKNFTKPLMAFLGFASKEEIFGSDYLESLGITVVITTDDGSFGHKGFPTDLLEKYLKEHRDTPKILYSCGPKPMLSIVKTIARRENWSAYLSLEERMACGIGACIGCSVKSSQTGYKKVCKDGPVFEAGEIELD